MVDLRQGRCGPLSLQLGRQLQDFSNKVYQGYDDVFYINILHNKFHHTATPPRRMFTEQDLKTLKKIKNSYYEKKSEESESSSICEQKSQDQLYFSRYFLNSSFKILHIDIIGTEQVAASLAKLDSYMIYIIKVMTEDYSYQVRRRYSQFLKLYESIMSYQALKGKNQRMSEIQKLTTQSPRIPEYLFPTKKISSSLRNFFNITNKEKIAEQRKSDLCSFLNQIKNNYTKFPMEFTDHYIELLKFIDMKQQHQKFWRRKQGRFLELSNIALRDSNLLNQCKVNDKANETNNNTINVEHLSELLQHQINKINLAVIARNSVVQSTTSVSSVSEIDTHTDPMITDQIIKNVDTIKDIVLEMKRRINYDHIRCIIKGRDIKQGKSTSSAPTQTKKGLVEFSLKYTKNQLVTIHILKTILNVFLNSQCNYSSQAFLKVFAELDLGILGLESQKDQLALENKQFREIYFKLVRYFIQSKEQFGADKKYTIQKFPTNKLMGVILLDFYEKWLEKQQKNKSFKLKDEQKEWTMVIQNLPKRYSPSRYHNLSPRNHTNSSLSLSEHLKSSNQSESQSRKSSLDKENCYEAKHNHAELLKLTLDNIQKQHLAEKNKYKSKNMEANLRTFKEKFYSYYSMKAIIKDIDFKECVELIRNEKSWNAALLQSQLDVYSNTKKERIKLPGKQEKMFRFVEQEEIQMNIEDVQLDKEIQFDNYQNFVPVGKEFDGYDEKRDINDPKMSTQTMPSVSGSCAHQFHPEHPEPFESLACSQNSQKTCFIKTHPQEGRFNSYTQRVKVQRLQNTKNHLSACLVQIQIYFDQETSIKYFNSQIQGATSCIWDGVINLFTKEEQNIFHQNKVTA